MNYIFSKILNQAILALGLTAAALGSASAAIITFSGDTTGGPTYNRTLSGAPPTNLSGVGTAVPYQTLGFTVDTTGTYVMQTTSANWSSADTYLSLYSFSFDPSLPLLNIIAADDDAGTNALSLINSVLTTGVQYYLVVASFENSEFGAFTGTIESASGTATLDNPTNTVPVPSSVALLGLGALALLRRRA
jgi:PEP-CTERM motif